MPESLTKMERRILDYLIDYLKKNTYQPSIREIGKRFSIKSTKTVSEHLQALADKGYIERDASRSRGVRILGMNLSPNIVHVPFYGKIAAGRPALSRECLSGEFEIDRKLIGSNDAFFLKVDGDSMEGAGILDGDMVVIEPVAQDDLHNGDFVAARIDGKATVKRYFAKDDEIVLEPANTDYAPMLVREYSDFTVLGRVTGLFRQLAEAPAAAGAGV
jgi:repressor LexA